jgi:hypothetical protein
MGLHVTRVIGRNYDRAAFGFLTRMNLRAGGPGVVGTGVPASTCLRLRGACCSGASGNAVGASDATANACVDSGTPSRLALTRPRQPEPPANATMIGRTSVARLGGLKHEGSRPKRQADMSDILTEAPEHVHDLASSIRSAREFRLLALDLSAGSKPRNSRGVPRI